MNDRLRQIGILYVRELRSALRERNIVVNSILLPIVLYPAILWLVYSAISFVAGQSDVLSSRVMLRNLPVEHRQILLDLEERNSVELTTLENPEVAIRRGELDLLVRFEAPDHPDDAFPDNFAVELVYDGSKDRSRTARARLTDQLDDYRLDYLIDTAGAIGIRPATLQLVWIDMRNIASGTDMGRFILGLLVPMFLIIMLSVGCIYPAIDSTAGERENSTWETLMTVATDRSNILLAKYFYVATMSFTAGMLNLAAMTFSLKAVLRPLAGDALDDLSIELPLGAIPVIVLGAALMALFIAAGMMILASFARTFKEGQSMIGPFYIALFLPVMFIQAPDIAFTPVLAAIPVVNVAMMFREAIAGVYQWPLIGITVAVELLAVSLALLLASRILQHEEFLLGGYTGGLGRFIKDRFFKRPRSRTREDQS